MGIRVRATQRGYYENLRHPGDEFEIKDKSEKGSWMEVVKPSKSDKDEDEKDA